MQNVDIVPSILESSSAAFRQRLWLLGRLHVPLHIDIADGLFVPAKTINRNYLAKLKLHTRDTVHLMVNDPAAWIPAVWSSGARHVIVQVESSITPLLLKELSRHVRVTLALNPKTLTSKIRPYAPFIHGIQVMTISPGKQGNPFIPSQLAVIRRLRREYPRKDIAADGSMNHSTLTRAIKAGATRLVVGSALKHISNIQTAYSQLKTIARSAGS